MIVDVIYATPPVELRKLAALALISTYLVAQFIYEQGIYHHQKLIRKE
jgi:hypothetical protein